MRPALFLSALLATALFGGTALAERTSDDSSSSRHASSAQDLKERVLHERGESRTVDRSSSRSDHASSRAEKFRSKGDTYENYGHRSGGAAASHVASHAAASKMAGKLLPGRSHGDIVDGQNKTSRTTTSGATLSTSPGAKNARSFVHMANDKGQVNTNVHGGTASSMKMRHVANVIMKTAVRDPRIKVFSWTSAGGDNQSLFPGT
jgi:hypothetical protein